MINEDISIINFQKDSHKMDNGRLLKEMKELQEA